MPSPITSIYTIRPGSSIYSKADIKTPLLPICMLISPGPLFYRYDLYHIVLSGTSILGANAPKYLLQIPLLQDPKIAPTHRVSQSHVSEQEPLGLARPHITPLTNCLYLVLISAVFLHISYEPTVVEQTETCPSHLTITTYEQ